MVSEIYFIRHGITEGNQKMWFYGKADLPLAKEGREALKKLSQAKVYPEIDDSWGCYTSGLRRTEETFEILFGNHPHETIENLREMEFGEYECCTYEELKSFENFDEWTRDESGDVALTGGESRNDFNKRIGKGLKELIGYHRLKELGNRHSGKDVHTVVVCHGGVISAVMNMLFPEARGNMWDWMVEPGFGYKVEFKDGEAISYLEIREP